MVSHNVLGFSAWNSALLTVELRRQWCLYPSGWVLLVSRAWKVGPSVATAAFVAVVDPSVVVFAGVGTIPRYVLLQKLWSTSWAAVA
jgi:hypothetical protein